MVKFTCLPSPSHHDALFGGRGWFTLIISLDALRYHTQFCSTVVKKQSSSTFDYQWPKEERAQAFVSMTHRRFTSRHKVSFDALALSRIFYHSLYANLTDVDAKLRDLVVVLREVDWYQLGIQLEVPIHILRKIERQHPHDESRMLTEMLEYWKDDEEDSSWEKIVKALQRISGHRKIITEIRSKYMSHGLSSSAALLERTPQLPFLQRSEDASLQRVTVENKAKSRYVLFYQ